LQENNDISKSMTYTQSPATYSGKVVSSCLRSSVSNFGLLTVQQFDPLGPPAERPRTGRAQQSRDDSDDDAEMNAESLLPI